jgi:hypothetical protein
MNILREISIRSAIFQLDVCFTFDSQHFVLTHSVIKYPESLIFFADFLSEYDFFF